MLREIAKRIIAIACASCNKLTWSVNTCKRKQRPATSGAVRQSQTKSGKVRQSPAKSGDVRRSPTKPCKTLQSHINNLTKAYHNLFNIYIYIYIYQNPIKSITTYQSLANPTQKPFTNLPKTYQQPFRTYQKPIKHMPTPD